MIDKDTVAKKMLNADIDFDLPPEVQALGFPTFKEWAKNPDKWRFGIDNLAEQIDSGGENLKKIMKRVRYRYEKYTCKSLFECMRVMNDDGYSLQDMEMKPQLIPLGGGKTDVLFIFMPKCPKGAIIQP